MNRREVLVALGGYGLPEAVVDFPGGPIPSVEWDQVCLDIRYQRLTGFATAAAENGHLLITDEQRADLMSEHVEAMAHVLRLEAHLLRISDLLGDRQIPFLVLKGSAVAHLDYPDVTLRSFADNDILIRPEDLDCALEHLVGHGYLRPAPQPGAGFDRRFGKGATLIASDGYELDVHRTFAKGPYGYTVDLDELWARPQPFEVGDHELHALGVEQRILHACYHAVVGNPYRRVQPHRDVAEMLLFGQYDDRMLRALASSWQADVILATAITRTWDLFGLTRGIPLLGWARSRTTSQRERRLLSVYETGTSYTAQCLACLSVIPHWRDKAAFVRLLSLPDSAFVEAHAGSRLGWLSRGAWRALHRRASGAR
jgi:hypothetical protein